MVTFRHWLRALALLVFLLLHQLAYTHEVDVKPAPDTVELTGKLVGNPFNQVVNGQRNQLVITFNNKGNANYTIRLLNVQLSKVGEPDQIVRNVTSVKFDLACPAMGLVEVPSGFYNEMHPQELNLRAVVLFSGQDDVMYHGVGFDEVVTIVEPEQSLFDLQLLFLYFILLLVFGGVGYFVFRTFFGDIKSKKRAHGPTPVEKQGPSSGQGYDEKWIPEQHLKHRRSPRLREKQES